MRLGKQRTKHAVATLCDGIVYIEQISEIYTKVVKIMQNYTTVFKNLLVASLSQSQVRKLNLSYHALFLYHKISTFIALYCKLHFLDMKVWL